MTWFYVDDHMAFHRKFVAAGNAATGLWTRAGSIGGQQNSDGIVPKAVANGLGTRQEIATLLRVGLWHAAGHECDRCVDPGPDAYVYHDWLDIQPSKADVDAKRAKRAAAGAKGGRKSGAVRRSQAEAAATANAEANASPGTKQKRTPSRPVPSGGRTTPPTTSSSPPPTTGLTADVARGILGTEAAHSARIADDHNPGEPTETKPAKPSAKTGCRIPDDFEPDPDLVYWVRVSAPDVPRSEHAKFVDYWRGVPGAKGRKVDWRATWRNWMRRAQEDIAAGRRAPAAGRSTTDERVAQAAALMDVARELDERDAANVIDITDRRAIGG